MVKRRKEFFTEQPILSNVGEYRLDLALKAKEAVLRSTDVSEPLPSTSLADQIERALSTQKHRK